MRIWVSISPTRSMRSTRRRSTFVWRSFRRRISAPPKRRSRCTAVGLARQHPELHPRLGWQAARRSRARPPPSRGQALLLPEAGAIYVMDRGYVDFARLHVLHLAGAFFVTRAKSNMDAHRVYSAAANRTIGIICDQTIALDGHYTSRHYPEHLRRIRFRDAESGKTLVFLTNQFGLPATTVCALYKSRWQVELFFKWIKQHLRIKQFFGTSENAVKTQIWIAVSVYVLVAIVKKRLALDASLYTLLQILSVTLFEKLPLDQALTHDAAKGVTSQITNQLNLFAY